MNSHNNIGGTPATTSNSVETSRFGLVFFAGLAAMVGLLLIVTLFSLYQLRTSRIIVTDLTTLQVPALGHIYTMANAAFQRTILLDEINETNDWVLHDEQINRFRTLGVRFGDHLRQLTDITTSDRELSILAKIRESAVVNEAVQNQAVEHARSGDRRRARKLLVGTVIPAQRKVMDDLAQLLEIHVAESESYALTTASQSQGAARIVLLMVPAALLLAVAIGIIVWRHSSSLVSRLQNTNSTLRETLNDLNQQKLALDAHAIVSITDAAGDIIYANDRFCDISGYATYELTGQNHRLLRSSEHDDRFFADMWETISRGEIWTGVVCNRNKSGGLYWVNTTIVPFLDNQGLPFQYVSVRTDITDVKKGEEALAEVNIQLEQRVVERTDELARLNRHLQEEIAKRDRLEAELRRLASHDSLTGLFNRRRFDQEFDREMSRCRRNHSPMAMILLDIDHFKAINDRYGHQLGDEVLRQIADILSKRGRSTDVIARWGGEEFVFLAVGSGSKNAVTVAESLRQTIETTDFGDVGRVTCSAGVASFSAGDTLHSLFARADRALYRAKENDRNRVELEESETGGE